MNSVYVLEAEVSTSTEYAGITRVYASQGAALRGLESWLNQNGIDVDIARYNQTVANGFIGNDVDPDLLNGSELSWGINTHEVIA